MSPPLLALFLFNLGLGTTITFASTHWMLAWMGLEINTMAIIPLMVQQHHPRATEATTKYFLTQAAASALLLFSATTNAWLTGQWTISYISNPLPNTVLTLALTMKMGLAPLHLWLPEVLQGLNLMTGLILSTWQKLAPMILLIQIYPTNHNLLMTIGLLSVLVGGWGGLNQTQLRKILAYSSIAHLGWMYLIIPHSPALAMLTLFIYFAMTYSMFLTFHVCKALNITNLALTWTKSPIIVVFMTMTLLTLGGVPPLTGFLPKMLIIYKLTSQNQTTLAILAATASLLSLFFYIRIAYCVTISTSPNNITSLLHWRILHAQPLYSLPLAVIMSSMALPLMPLLTLLVTP